MRRHVSAMRSRRCSSPTAARSPCASSAPAASWASPPSPSSRRPTARRCTCCWPTRRTRSGRRRPPRATSSIDKLVAAARAAGADAVHPGYGFLAENARFAEACVAAGLTFIGPAAGRHPRDGRQDGRPPHRARDGACRWCPGTLEPVARRRRGARAWPREIGYPVMLKAAMGGGGKGMRLVRAARRAGRRAARRALARRAPRSATPPSTSSATSMEPRHIEIQVLADAPRHASCTWASASARSSAATRSWSRRARRPSSTPELRARMGEAACRVAARGRLRQRGHRRVPRRRASATSTSSR